MGNNVSRAAIAAVALAAFLFVGFYVVDTGIQESRHDITVTNETFTPDGGQLEVFANSRLNRATYDETVTVRNDSSGATLSESGNYTWFNGNGTLKVTNNSELDKTSTAAITYGYFGQTLEQASLTNIVTRIMGVMVPLSFIAFVGFLAIALFVIGRFV